MKAWLLNINDMMIVIWQYNVCDNVMILTKKCVYDKYDGKWLLMMI